MKLEQVMTHAMALADTGERAVTHLRNGLVVRVSKAQDGVLYRIAVSRENGRSGPSAGEVQTIARAAGFAELSLPEQPEWDGTVCRWVVFGTPVVGLEDA